MALTIQCTHCNQPLGLAQRKKGARITCPVCGGSVTVPDGAASVTAERIRGEAEPVSPDGEKQDRLTLPESELAAGQPDATAPRGSHRKPDGDAGRVSAPPPPPPSPAAAPQPRPGPAAARRKSTRTSSNSEPWLYRFAPKYAKVFLVLAGSALVIAMVAGVARVLSVFRFGEQSLMAVAAVAAIVAGGAAVFLALLLGVAVLLLVVDVGRNVRELRERGNRRA